MFSPQIMQAHLKFQIVIAGFLLTLLTLNMVATAVRIPVPVVLSLNMMLVIILVMKVMLTT